MARSKILYKGGLKKNEVEADYFEADQNWVQFSKLSSKGVIEVILCIAANTVAEVSKLEE